VSTDGDKTSKAFFFVNKKEAKKTLLYGGCDAAAASAR
jgi:hypothetical protein